MGCAPSSQVCDSKMADFSISSNSATRSSSIAAHSTVIEKSNYNNRNIEIPTYNVASLFDENPERLASPKSNERVENEIEEEVFSTNSTISVFSTKQTTKFPSSYLKDNHSERSVIPEVILFCRSRFCIAGSVIVFCNMSLSSLPCYRLFLVSLRV